LIKKRGDKITPFFLLRTCWLPAPIGYVIIPFVEGLCQFVIPYSCRYDQIPGDAVARDGAAEVKQRIVIGVSFIE
jgi:hypothetical protein